MALSCVWAIFGLDAEIISASREGAKLRFTKDKSHNDLMGVISSALNAAWGGEEKISALNAESQVGERRV